MCTRARFSCLQTQTHSVFFGTLKYGSPESRDPFLDFPRPIVQCRLWDNNEMRAGGALVELEVSEERDGLKSFTQTLDP